MGLKWVHIYIHNMCVPRNYPYNTQTHVYMQPVYVGPIWNLSEVAYIIIWVLSLFRYDLVWFGVFLRWFGLIMKWFGVFP